MQFPPEPLVRSTSGAWMVRPPQHCPNGHRMQPGRILVGSRLLMRAASDLVVRVWSHYLRAAPDLSGAACSTARPASVKSIWVVILLGWRGDLIPGRVKGLLALCAARRYPQLWPPCGQSVATGSRRQRCTAERPRQPMKLGRLPERPTSQTRTPGLRHPAAPAPAPGVRQICRWRLLILI